MRVKNTMTSIERGVSFRIADSHLSKVYICGNVVEVITVKNKPQLLSRYKKVNKDSYVDTETGELLEYNPSRPRNKNIKGLVKTMNNLRRVINLNFIGDDSERHVCLTYGTEMHDYNQASIDFSKFWGKLKYHHPDLEYIRILEPQHSGRWHIHLLVKHSTGEVLYLDFDHLRQLWGLAASM